MEMEVLHTEVTMSANLKQAVFQVWQFLCLQAQLGTIKTSQETVLDPRQQIGKRETSTLRLATTINLNSKLIQTITEEILKQIRLKTLITLHQEFQRELTKTSLKILNRQTCSQEETSQLTR